MPVWRQCEKDVDVLSATGSDHVGGWGVIRERSLRFDEFVVHDLLSFLVDHVLQKCWVASDGLDRQFFGIVRFLRWGSPAAKLLKPLASFARRVGP